MTCAHVLNLIDAGPFAGVPRARLDAAWQHARGCPTCGPALEAATALTADLKALPRPAPPPNLAGAVLARIAQIEAVRPVPAAPVTPHTGFASGARDGSAWVTALGGIAAGLAVVVSTPLGAPISTAWPGVRAIAAGALAIPSTVAGALVLAAGLALYVTGLFRPLSGRRRS